MKKIISILKKKSIPLDEFINIALYDKDIGFYMKKNPFGKKGHFITSPIISNLFAEMITIWCISFWYYLGKPKKILFVELGPGDGSLCKNILDISKKFNEFYNCLEINLLEISSKLQSIQKKKIKNKKVKWINKLEEINSGPIIFFGNEFFDALPIKQFYKKKKSLYEKYITLSKDKKKLELEYKKAQKKLIKNIKSYNLLVSGDVVEYPASAIKYLSSIAKKINKYDGGLLTFDYGYTKNKNKNTLQAVKNHMFINPFEQPGNSDITSHVNFSLFIEILNKNKLEVNKVVTQNEFLQKMGIRQRADILSSKMTFKKKISLFYQLKKMLSYKEMGQLFKVLFAQKKGKKFSLGF